MRNRSEFLKVCYEGSCDYEGLFQKDFLSVESVGSQNKALRCVEARPHPGEVVLNCTDP